MLADLSLTQEVLWPVVGFIVFCVGYSLWKLLHKL